MADRPGERGRNDQGREVIDARHVATLLHEAGHATTATVDATREYERMLTDYLGKTTGGAIRAVGFGRALVSRHRAAQPATKPMSKPERSPRMRLSSGNAKTIENPTDDELRRVLRSLDNKDNYFAILAKSALTYMQATGSVKDGFDLEHQAGSTDKHYEAVNPPFTLNQVVMAFRAYRDQTSGWRTAFRWKKQQIA